MNETNSNEYDPISDFQREENELRTLMWGMLDGVEKSLIVAYRNCLVNNKVVHPKMQVDVGLIMERYPDFDMSCVP